MLIWDSACKTIDDFDWDTVLTENIDEAWDKWLQQFMSIMNQFKPNCTLRCRRIICPGSQSP